jgi:hypothetical protein
LSCHRRRPPAADPNGASRLSHLELGPFTRLAEALRDRILGKPEASAVAPPTFVDGLASMMVMDAVRTLAARGGECVRP